MGRGSNLHNLRKNYLLLFLSCKIFVDKVQRAVAGGEAWGEADIGPALLLASTFARLHLALLLGKPSTPLSNQPPATKAGSVAKGSPKALRFTVNYVSQ